MKNLERIRIYALVATTVAVFALSSCGTSKKATGGGRLDGGISQERDDAAMQAVKTAFLQKVCDNAVYAKDITSKVELTLRSGDKELSVAGSLKMRRDEVIRIQITPMGLMEVGRIEFGRDSVLIMDRMNKEYVTGSYADIDFLKNNVLDFYALQSLYWNELFMPGEQGVKDSMLKRYEIEWSDTAAVLPIIYGKGKLACEWHADAQTGRIASTCVAYDSGTHGRTALTYRYSGFTAVGSKFFPSLISMDINTEADVKKNNLGLTMRLKGISTDSDWEAHTAVSSKYKKVEAETLLMRLLGL